MGFDVTIDRDALAREVAAFEDSLERAVFAGLDYAAQQTAAQARAAHWYQNRTHDLEDSTQAQESDGDVWGDSASSSVAATMPYASYVDARQRILEPAWDAVAGRVEHEFEFLLEQACR